MKAAAFDYVRSESLGQTLDLLAQHGGDAKLLAGCQRAQVIALVWVWDTGRRT